MSAWIVSRAHIDALVLAGVQWGVIERPDPATLTETGRMLWAECLASVAYRYPEDVSGRRPGPNDFEDSDVPAYTAPSAEVLLSAAGVVKAAACYRYQSCKHPGWEEPDNPARRYVEDLRLAVLASLSPEQVVRRHGEDVPLGYDAAPWGIDDLAQIAVTVESGRS
jgi:hypothetical protein